MFDDLENKKSVASNENLVEPSKPTIEEKPKNAPLEDIFSETDNKPEVLQPKKDIPQEEIVIQQEDLGGGASSIKKILILLFFVCFLVVLGYGGFWAYNYLDGQGDDIIVEEIDDVDMIGENNNEDLQKDQGSDSVESKNEEVKIEEQITKEKNIDNMIDSDQDGLTDMEEMELKTNLNKVDSDDDGLFDREEVEVYKTNPLNRDTDGDGYLDGEEVRGGYNPLGAGKLYEIK